MVMRVEKTADAFHIVIPIDAARSLNLDDGSIVDVTPVSSTEGPVIRYLTNEEAVEAYRATLPRFRRAYEDLAK
jgi:hypothetical protein